LREDLPAGARRLAEALRGYADAERAFGASESAEVEDGDSTTVASQTSLPRLLKPSGGVDLPECWSALETVRAEIVGEPDPALRAVKHSRLDSAALELADAALDRRFALHRQIVQDISHDVRSPLSSILLLADSLLNGPGPLSPLQRRQASILYDASVSLVRLVNDIIDVSRMDHEGEIPVERVPFSVPELLEEVGRLAMPFAEHRAVELVMESTSCRTASRLQVRAGAWRFAWRTRNSAIFTPRSWTPGSTPTSRDCAISWMRAVNPTLAGKRGGLAGWVWRSRAGW
jgi:signal transduction histidine kinase